MSGLGFPGDLEARPAVRRLADDLVIGLALKKLANAPTDGIVIVDNDDPSDRGRHDCISPLVFVNYAKQQAVMSSERADGRTEKTAIEQLSSRQTFFPIGVNPYSGRS